MRSPSPLPSTATALLAALIRASAPAAYPRHEQPSPSAGGLALALYRAPPRRQRQLRRATSTPTPSSTSPAMPSNRRRHDPRRSDRQFINDDNEPHTVTANDKSFDSEGTRHATKPGSTLREARHVRVFLRAASVHEGRSSCQGGDASMKRGSFLEHVGWTGAGIPFTLGDGGLLTSRPSPAGGERRSSRSCRSATATSASHCPRTTTSRAR